MMNQRNAVFAAISSIFGNIEAGTDIRSSITKDQRAQVNTMLCTWFQAGEVELKDTPSNQAKLADESELRGYVSGLISNWLNKDERLNGGVKHEVKNPGSRAGSGDAQVKALKALLANAKDEDEKVEIQGYLDSRIAELDAAKPKQARQVKINFDDLPEELKAKYSVS